MDIVKQYFSNIAQWNGISPNLFIKTIKFSDNENEYADIVIYGDDNLSTLGHTESRKLPREITLGTGIYQLLDVNYEKKVKTLVHEMGHAIGLSHPREKSDPEGCYYDYKALMRQS